MGHVNPRGEDGHDAEDPKQSTADMTAFPLLSFHIASADAKSTSAMDGPLAFSASCASTSFLKLARMVSFAKLQ
ncbi:hypothetical protein GH714_018567 [Hevea brasiliensis]|uniref:Uncharacterized protein n=1 Tax=Hevea brasiliensis TaxID=3981 RepID=A0A6A6MJF7_HEVBR|nr:hypothetical protein GH714_018567 [Hevea brasiliensis]